MGGKLFDQLVFAIAQVRAPVLRGLLRICQLPQNMPALQHPASHLHQLQGQLARDADVAVHHQAIVRAPLQGAAFGLPDM
jgi:hypothetical protein